MSDKYPDGSLAAQFQELKDAIDEFKEAFIKEAEKILVPVMLKIKEVVDEILHRGGEEEGRKGEGLRRGKGMGMKKITDDMLKGACKDQREIFRKEWPNGAPVTLKSAKRAVELGLNIWWLARLLPKPLLDEYERQRKPLLDEYERQVKPLLAEYERQVKPLLDEYLRQIARVLVPLLKRV